VASSPITGLVVYLDISVWSLAPGEEVPPRERCSTWVEGAGGGCTMGLSGVGAMVPDVGVSMVSAVAEPSATYASHALARLPDNVE
jgi:hypothetical protein